MTILHILLLAIVQGLTEFLPISSSGHLILASQFAGLPDQGLAFDVAVHFGSLIAVVIYFRNDLVALTRGFFATRVGKPVSVHGKLAWLLIVATIPIVLAVLALPDGAIESLRRPDVIAIATAFFALLLWAVDYFVPRRDRAHVGWLGGLFIGASQILALIPGTSRSGITMTAGRYLGLSRSAAARFSFLLSVPVIFLAGASQALELLQQPMTQPWTALAIAVTASALSAFLCIKLFLGFVERIGFLPFVVYRLLLALVIWIVLV